MSTRRRGRHPVASMFVRLRTTQAVTKLRYPIMVSENFGTETDCRTTAFVIISSTLGRYQMDCEHGDDHFRQPAQARTRPELVFGESCGSLMAKRRIYKRDRRGRFAPTGSSRARRTSSTIKRRRPRYVRGSLGNTVRIGRVGPGGEYAGVHMGAKLRTKRRAEYYVGVSAGRRIATPY